RTDELLLDNRETNTNLKRIFAELYSAPGGPPLPPFECYCHAFDTLTSLSRSATLYAPQSDATEPVRREALRIVSLLPSATEIVYALNLGEALVGVTHECDYPADARTKAIVTRSLLDHSQASSAEIDQAVRQQLQDGLSLYSLDDALLGQLAPDLILTQ